jgi:hypothetical protein
MKIFIIFIFISLAISCGGGNSIQPNSFEQEELIIINTGNTFSDNTYSISIGPALPSGNNIFRKSDFPLSIVSKVTYLPSTNISFLAGNPCLFNSVAKSISTGNTIDGTGCIAVIALISFQPNETKTSTFNISEQTLTFSDNSIEQFEVSSQLNANGNTIKYIFGVIR